VTWRSSDFALVKPIPYRPASGNPNWSSLPSCCFQPTSGLSSPAVFKLILCSPLFVDKIAIKEQAVGIEL